MARATGKKVLLIDGDLRAPDVHHVFGRQMTPGLVGYLSGDGDWRDYVDREWNESIHIFSAGYLKGSPRHSSTRSSETQMSFSYHGKHRLSIAM